MSPDLFDLPRGLGIELNVFFFLDGHPCCHVWIPQHAEDAEYRLLAGLKLVITHDLWRVTPIKNWLHWRWLKTCEALCPYSRWRLADSIPLARDWND